MPPLSCRRLRRVTGGQRLQRAQRQQGLGRRVPGRAAQHTEGLEWTVDVPRCRFGRSAKGVIAGAARQDVFSFQFGSRTVRKALWSKGTNDDV